MLTHLGLESKSILKSKEDLHLESQKIKKDFSNIFVKKMILSIEKVYRKVLGR